MTCGRAESQTNAHEFPKHFSPEVPHEPLKAVQSDKWDQDGKRLDCEGSLLVIKDLHLGSYVTTDVFELVLQHPETHEYLLVNDNYFTWGSCAIEASSWGEYSSTMVDQDFPLTKSPQIPHSRLEAKSKSRLVAAVIRLLQTSL